MLSILVIGAVLIIIALAGTAAYFQFRLFEQRKQRREREQILSEAADAKRQEINNSVQIICRALLARQVEYAEASIRISGLLDALGVAEQERSDFIAFDKMADAIKHIPRLDAWKSLPKKERLHYRRQIDLKEQELSDFLDDAARRLLGRSF